MLRIFQSRFLSTMKIPIQAIKKLREQTSAPLGQCKTALQQSNCDHAAAMKWLKQKGLIQAEKRVSKQTRQGVIGAMVTACRSKVALVQVNCQTDFVAKNQLFVNFTNNVLAKAIQAEYLLNYEKEEHKQGIEGFLHHCKSSDLFPEEKDISTLQQQLKIMISRLQQNIRVRRIITLHSDNKKYGVYVHQGYNQFVGLQAAVTQFEVEPALDEQNEDQMAEFGQFADNMATQILGSFPKYMRMDQIPKQIIEQQTQRVKSQMADRLSKAPAHTHEKIVKGKLNTSFYQEKLLPKMPYVLSNDGEPVEQYWGQVEKQLGKTIKITNAFFWGCK